MKKNIKSYLIILASLLDEIALVGLVLLILWFFKVKITLLVAIFIGLVFIASIFIIHKYLVPAFQRRKITGAEGMVGIEGEVVEALNPQGLIKIGDEYWKAKSTDRNIEVGEVVEIIGIDGLKLRVIPKEKKDNGKDRK